MIPLGLRSVHLSLGDSDVYSKFFFDISNIPNIFFAQLTYHIQRQLTPHPHPSLLTTIVSSVVLLPIIEEPDPTPSRVVWQLLEHSILL